MKQKRDRCPYETSQHNCVHKAMAIPLTKKSHPCGHSNQDDCDLYCEYDEIRKSCERASKGELKHSGEEDDND